MRILILGLFLLLGCGVDDTTTNPAQLATGSGGGNGSNSKNGSNCSTEAAENGAKIICEDGTESFIENGEDGLNGENGVDGADGQNGVDGSNSASGAPIVEDRTGAAIGDLLFIDENHNFAVIMDDGTRLKVDIDSNIEQLRTFFSQPSCMGERRAALIDGQFGTFGKDNWTNNGYWKVNTENLSWFTYRSYEDGEGNCIDEFDTAPNSYGIELDADLGFTFPFVTPVRIR